MVCQHLATACTSPQPFSKSRLLTLLGSGREPLVAPCRLTLGTSSAHATANTTASAQQQHQHSGSASTRSATAALLAPKALVPSATYPAKQLTQPAAAVALATSPAGPAAAAVPAVLKPAVALDVEYAHFLTADGKHISVPAWVAVVDQDCTVVLKTVIQHQVEPTARWIGGVPQSACAAAPVLTTVLRQLQQLTAGQLLLGHGLAKDLSALGFDHPTDLQYDTMTHPAFCNSSGNSKNLKQLARQFLAQDIQQPQQQQGRRRRRGKPTGSQQQHQQALNALHRGAEQQEVEPQPQHLQQTAPLLAQQQQRQQVDIAGVSALPAGSGRSGHDPEEDAAAVMKLYQQVIYPSTYEGQVAAATARTLAAMQQHVESV